MNPYEKLFDLSGKVVLVAGGSGAIGSELAAALSAYGAKVAVAGRSEKMASAIAARLDAGGGEAMGVVMDVTDATSVESGVATVQDRLGPIDVLINCAGAHIEQPAEQMTLEAWDAVLDVNLRGAFILSQAVARSMIARGKGGSHIHMYGRPHVVAHDGAQRFGDQTRIRRLLRQQGRVGHPDQAARRRVGQVRDQGEWHCAYLHAHAAGSQVPARSRLLRCSGATYPLGAGV